MSLVRLLREANYDLGKWNKWQDVIRNSVSTRKYKEDWIRRVQDVLDGKEIRWEKRYFRLPTRFSGRNQWVLEWIDDMVKDGLLAIHKEGNLEYIINPNNKLSADLTVSDIVSELGDQLQKVDKSYSNSSEGISAFVEFDVDSTSPIVVTSEDAYIYTKVDDEYIDKKYGGEPGEWTDVLELWPAEQQMKEFSKDFRRNPQIGLIKQILNSSGIKYKIKYSQSEDPRNETENTNSLHFIDDYPVKDRQAPKMSYPCTFKAEFIIK